MLTTRRKLYAMALVAAMLFTSVNPVTAHAEDAVVTSTHNHGTLTVTADLVDDKGTATLENLNWDKIEIPSDLGAKKVVLKNVITAELVIESNTSCEFEISGGSITKLVIAESEIEEMDLSAMADLIAAGMSKSEAQEEYQKSKKELKAKKNLAPVITLKDNAVVGTIEAAGNASLSLKDGKVDKLQVVSETAGNNLKLTVDGFNGTLTVDQKAAKGTGFGTLQLELKNSKPAKAEINSDGKGSIVLNGTDSVIAAAVVEGSASLVLNVETKKLETAKDSKDVELVVLASVEEVVVNGEATDVNVTSGAVVKKAVINGANATVEGKGKVESAAVSDETAKVTTKDTEVYDPAKVTATPVPTAKPTSKPSSGGSSGGGGSSSGGSGGGSWYPVIPTATPRPTATPVPTEAPEATVTPTPTATPVPDVHVHTWNVEAATCVTAKQCTDEECGYIEEAATGLHEFAEEGIITMPTCTEGGYTTYTCKYCDETKQDSITGSAGHSVAEWAIGELVEGETCLYTQVGTCTACGETVTSETNVAKHSEELGVGVEEATCTVVGYKKYYCPDCGKTLAKEEYSNPEAHKWVLNADGTYSCEYCDATKTVVDMTEDGIASDTLDENTEVALSTGVSITLDSDVLAQVQTATGSATTATGTALKLSADVVDDTTREEAVAGLTEDQKAQLGESEIYDFNMFVDEDQVSDFAGAVTVRIPYTLADGEDPDGIIVWYINDNGEVESITGTYYNGYVTFKTNHFSYYTVVRLTPEQRCKLYGHIMLSATTNPTCTEDGYVTSICQRCAATEVTPGEKATGHNIVVEVIEEATCQHKGKHRHECNNKHCEFYTEVETPKGDHKPKETGKKKDATCLEAGYIEYKCDDDKCEYHKKEEIKAKGHKQGKDGKCKNCGIDMTCEHENHVLLVELAEGATTCLDGVNVTKYCPECDSVVEQFTVKEHYCKVVDILNHWSYGEDSAGYLYLYGCACGEIAPVIGQSRQNRDAWSYSNSSYTDENGILHYVDKEYCGTVTLQKDYVDLSQNGCEYTRDVTWSLIVNGDVIDQISAVLVESAHYIVSKGKLSEGSTTCEDGIEGTNYCLNCGMELGSWTATTHRNCVVEAFDLSEYSETACGGSVMYYRCPCGQNGYIDYWNDVKCNFSSNWDGNTIDGIYHETATMTCQDCGFKFVDSYSMERLDGCNAKRNGTLSFYSGDTVAETYDYSFVTTWHDTYSVVKLANENSKSCLDGVNVESYCRICKEKVSEYTATWHQGGLEKSIDLSKYTDTCGGKVEYYSCACGEEMWLNVDVNDIHDLVWNYEYITDEDGKEYQTETVDCAKCEFNYYQKWSTAKNEDCTAVQEHDYQFYVGDQLIDTLVYTDLTTMHDIYYAASTLVTEGTTCEDGINLTQKCRDCDYTWTGVRYGHEQVEKEVIDLADYGAACEGYIYVNECACGMYSNSTVDFTCDYGYSWDYTYWNNYEYIGEEDGIRISRAEYQCSVTDPEACGFKFAMEQQEWSTDACHGDGVVYFCIDTDGDGEYETKFKRGEYGYSGHNQFGDTVVEYTEAEDGTKLKVETRTCACEDGYVNVTTYADYLNDDSYCYMIESTWGTEGNMEYETWDYAFDVDGCCSYTRIRSNDNGYYEVLETRPACVTDEVLSWYTCTQYSVGVCKMCGNENALHLTNYGYPQKHDFTYNSETGMYECNRCGLENEKGANGTITLEDMSDETSYIAGYWNGGEPRGVNELVYSVYVFLHTEAEDIMTDLEVTDAKCFDTGKVSLSKTAVAEWATANGVTADYDVMFSFIPKNASVDTAFNITFTEE